MESEKDKAIRQAVTLARKPAPKDADDSGLREAIAEDEIAADRGENVYMAFYNSHRVEIRAESLYAAKQKAIAEFRPPRSRQHLVAVMLAETAGKPVIQSPTF